MVSTEIGVLYHLDNKQIGKNKIDIKSISTPDLISRCVNNPSEVLWYEFYRRFDSYINKIIYKTLIEYNQSYNPERIEEIHFGIIEKIHGKENILKEAIKYPSIQVLLSTTVRNHAISWIRDEKRQKNAHNLAVEKSMTSLFKTVDSDEKIYLIDTLPCVNKPVAFYDEVKEINEEVNLLQGIQRLVIKTNIMFEEPFSAEDIQEIADIRKVSKKKILQEIDDIMDTLVQKNNQLEHYQNRVFIISYFLDRLNMRVNILMKDPLVNKLLIETVEKGIKQKTEQLANLEKKAEKKPIHPSARQIAGLLGIGKEAEKNINTWLHRSRKKLKEKLK